jgi:hypothetical protein
LNERSIKSSEGSQFIYSLDEPDDISQGDLIHLQDQITILDFLDPFTVAEMEQMKND